MTNRIGYLDGLRAVAILSVVAVHWAAPRTGVFTGGYVGVDVFFVLSGFLVTRILAKRGRSYGEFVRGRVRRLYPALLGLVLIGLPLAVLFPGSPVHAGDALRGGILALVQAGAPARAVGVDMTPFGITWSLALEWYFYLLWPLIVTFMARRGWSWARCSAWTTAAAVTLWLAALPLSADWFYYGPPARFAAMLAGAALAFWTMQGRPTRLTARVGSPVAAAALAVIGVWAVIGPGEHSMAYRFAGVPLVAIATVAVIHVGWHHPQVAPARWLSWSPAQALGRVSYSLYLWHTMPLAVLTGSAFGLSPAVLAAIGVAMVVGCTWFSYALLERFAVRPRGRHAVAAATSSVAIG